MAAVFETKITSISWFCDDGSGKSTLYLVFILYIFLGKCVFILSRRHRHKIYINGACYVINSIKYWSWEFLLSCLVKRACFFMKQTIFNLWLPSSWLSFMLGCHSSNGNSLIAFFFSGNLMRFIVPANLLGLPAITVPVSGLDNFRITRVIRKTLE